MANESRLELVDGRRRRPLASCVSAIPLTWLLMFRSDDLVTSASVRFTTSWESAARRLDDPRILGAAFASYGDLSPHGAMLADTIASHMPATGSAAGSSRVSIDVSELAGEHPDRRVWARQLARALDTLDDPALAPAPTAAPVAVTGGLTQIDKIKRLRRSAGVGITEARSLLRDHEDDLDAALEAIESAKSHEERARDRVGAFVAGLVAPAQPSDRPPWQVLFEASGLEYGVPFPPADLLLDGSVVTDHDLRTHDRILGEAVEAGTAAWEPAFMRPTEP